MRFAAAVISGLGVFVSYFSSRRSPSPRFSPENEQERTRLSPWHLLGIGLIALLGTGILAAIDRYYARTATASLDPPRASATSDVVIIDAPVVERPARSPTAEAPQRPAMAASQTPAPSSNAAEPNASPAASSASVRESAAPIAPSSRVPAFLAAAGLQPARVAPAAPAVEPAPHAPEGPVVTASVSAPPAPPRAAAPAAPPRATAPDIVASGAIKTSAVAPLDCLPAALRTVLADLSAHFGEVTVVSTNQLNTSNHTTGGGRDKLHHNCKAVDFRVDRSRIEDVKAYLRTRPEIGGVASYQNGIIHMDVNKPALAATPARAPTTSARPAAQATQAVPADAMRAPAAPSQATVAASPLAPLSRDGSR